MPNVVGHVKIPSRYGSSEHRYSGAVCMYRRGGGGGGGRWGGRCLGFISTFSTRPGTATPIKDYNTHGCSTIPGANILIIPYPSPLSQEPVKHKIQCTKYNAPSDNS